MLFIFNDYDILVPKSKASEDREGTELEDEQRSLLSAQVLTAGLFLKTKIKSAVF